MNIDLRYFSTPGINQCIRWQVFNRLSLWTTVIFHVLIISILYYSVALAKSDIELIVLTEHPAPPAPPKNLRLKFLAVNYDIYFRQLNDQVSTNREDAAQILSTYGRFLGDHVEHLAEALKNNDPIVRRHIAAALSELGSKAYPAVSPLVDALGDADSLVRTNAVAAIGNIGLSASFAERYLLTLLNDNDLYVRANAAGALGKIGANTAATASHLTKLLNDDQSMVRQKAMEALAIIGPKAYLAIPTLIKLLQEGATHERELIAETLAEIAITLHDNKKIEPVSQLEQVKTALTGIKDPGFEGYVKSVNRAIEHLILLKESNQLGIEETMIVFEDEIPKEFLGAEALVVNGMKLPVSGINPIKRVLCCQGSTNFLKMGVNYIETKANRMRFWYEMNMLKRFDIPYKRSYAIIAAIDDYERKMDPRDRGPTGYGALDFMIDDANELVKALKTIGFPRENIFEFYDKDCTSTNLTTILNEFWQGGQYENADRLFFYFGGHGDVINDSAYLVTFDFEQGRPTLSTILMHDLTGRHFENFTVHHVLLALDSCSSGLTLPAFLNADHNEERMKAFRTLSIINGETRQPARNVLVAGTANQKALYKNGGIFTKVLIDGLYGKADYNKDRVIQFDELSMFIKNRVRAKANERGVRQEPVEYQATKYGRGNILFFLPH